MTDEALVSQALPEQETPPQKRGLRQYFSDAAGFIRDGKQFEAGAIIAGILLGTTAIVTPALVGMIGTGIAVAAGGYVLNRLRHMEMSGKHANLKKGGLAALGIAALATPFLGTIAATGAALGAGLYLLLKTGDVVVENAAALGKKAGISSMTMGVALGVLTSLPELVVSTTSLLAGNASIAISNITGSNVANLLLILGGTAVIKKIDSKGMSWKFNAAAMIGATGILGAQLAYGVLNPLAGAAMLGAMGLYMWKSYKVSQKDAADEKQQAAGKPAVEKPAAAIAAEEEDSRKPESRAPKWLNIAWGLAGVAGLVGGATFTVAGAVAFGAAAGISTAVVGILAVAVGTSLPELVVNVKSALKGDTDMAVGNILGSNVFNILGIGGLLALAGPTVPPDLNPKGTLLGLFNTLAFGGSALLAAATMQKTKGTISRKTGMVWMGLYAAFTAVNAYLGRTPGAEVSAAPPSPLPPGPR